MILDVKFDLVFKEDRVFVNRKNNLSVETSKVVHYEDKELLHEILEDYNKFVSRNLDVFLSNTQHILTILERGHL